MRQGSIGARPFCCADGMRPISSGTVYVTVAGRLLALAEVGNGELIPKRVFNLTGLTASSARNRK